MYYADKIALYHFGIFVGLWEKKIEFDKAKTSISTSGDDAMRGA
jgi:hypothetical protein